VEVVQWSATQADNPILDPMDMICKMLMDISSYHSELEKADKSNQSQLKSQLIAGAQAIVVESKRIRIVAEAIAVECTDKMLSKQLESTLIKVDTLAHQLKIVAAVKAASPNDRDKGQQLIQCAQNLVKTLKVTLKNASSASLKVRRSIIK
jgi:hypothetical protein